MRENYRATRQAKRSKPVILFKLSCLAALLLVFSACSSGPNPALETETQSVVQDFLVSKSTDRSSSRVLDTSAVAGNVYVFTAQTSGVKQVEFYLDDVKRSGAPYQTEAVAPFDLRGGNVGSANPLDTTKLSNGMHTVTARMRYTSGSEKIATASFLVDNSGDESVRLTDKLLVSPAPDRSGAKLLGGSVTGKVYVFVVPSGNVKQVSFYLDDTGRKGTPAQTERIAFYDLAGTATTGLANSFDTSKLTAGQHTLTAAILSNSGQTQVVSSSFTVGTGTSTPAPTPDPKPEPSPEPSPTYDHLEQIFVSPAGSDTSVGSKDRPLKTATEGLRKAIDNRKRGLGTRLNLAAGVYRESLTGGYASGSAPLIVIEALEPGKVVISGADLWGNWSCDSTVCSHAWLYNWGAAPNPWPDAIQIGELARRREMVIVNGVNMEQKLSRSALTPGSFYVEESSDRLYLKPPSGVTIQSAAVEVAVRPSLMRLQGLSNLVVKGLVFRHAATPFRSAAVEIVDQNDVVVDDSTVEWNGQNGLWLKGYRLTIRNTTTSHNGSSGVSAYKAADVLLEDTESSYNNWRGVRGNYTSWEVGQKFSLVHRLTLRRHVSEHNEGKGFWFDTDVVDAVIEDSRFCHNLTGGIFVEKNQGPIRIQNSTFCNNGEFGIVTSATHKLTLQGNLITDNQRSQLFFSGDYDRSVTNWETGQRYTLNNEAWVVRNNQIKSSADLLFSTSHPASKWQAFMSSADFDYNAYASTASIAFQGPDGKRLDFPGWQSYTKQDAHSSFTPLR